MGVRMTDNCRFAPVSPTEKLVLLVLADCHNDETGRCFPGLAYLSKVTGLTRRGIQKAINKLETAGIIHVQRGNGVSSTYQLPASPYADQRTTFTREPDAPVNEGRPTDEPCSPPGANVVHGRGECGSPKPEENQNREPENNLNGSFSERSAIRKTPELGSSPSSRSRKEGHTHARHHKGKGNARDAADPRFHPIITQWHEAYHAETGEAYILHGGRDGAALKRFLQSAASVTPDDFMERARAAWARYKADRFATKCAQAATLHGFCTCWNDIGQQLKTPTPAEAAQSHALASTARRSTPHHARDERGQKPGEIPTDVRVDEIRRL